MISESNLEPLQLLKSMIMPPMYILPTRIPKVKEHTSECRFFAQVLIASISIRLLKDPILVKLNRNIDILQVGLILGKFREVTLRENKVSYPEEGLSTKLMI